MDEGSATKTIIFPKFKKGEDNTLVGKKTSYAERATTTKLYANFIVQVL